MVAMKNHSGAQLNHLEREMAAMKRHFSANGEKFFKMPLRKRGAEGDV
jgi:hypothetical protein